MGNVYDEHLSILSNVTNIQDMQLTYEGINAHFTTYDKSGYFFAYTDILLIMVITILTAILINKLIGSK